MAIITIALPVTGIRGTIAGVVFSANRAGPFAKGWRPCTHSRTPNQLEQRGYLAQAGAKWRTLSTADQNDWDTFADTPPETDYNSLNEVYKLSGFGWFTRIFLRRLRTSQVEDLIAPTNTPTAPPTSFSLALHPAYGLPWESIFYYTSGEFTTYYAILTLSIAPGLGTNVQTTRYLNMWEGIGAGDTASEFGAQYFEAFGVTQLGQRFFGHLYRQSPSGIRSTPLAVFQSVTP